MLCRLYGLENCTSSKLEWAPLAHHVLTTGESFNWEHIFLMVLKEEIEKYEKTLTSRKPTIYLSTYIMEVLFLDMPFLAMRWDWKKIVPPIHIYCSALWEDNFITLAYDIFDHFVGSISQNNFKQDAATFSDQPKTLISKIWVWHVGDYLSYIDIWGNNTVHGLPRIVPEIMVLEEISFQKVIDGVFPKLTADKRKGWTNFPLNLGSLVI